MTVVAALNATAITGGAAPFMAGGGHRRAVIVARWLAGTGTLLRNLSLLRVAAAVEIVCRRKLESPCLVFCFFLLECCTAFSFAVLMLSLIVAYGDCFPCLGLWGGGWGWGRFLRVLYFWWWGCGWEHEFSVGHDVVPARCLAFRYLHCSLTRRSRGHY